MTLRKTPTSKVILYSLFTFLCLYFLTIAASRTLFGEESPILEDPHAFMRVRKSCPSCHVGDPAINKGNKYRHINFKKDIFSLCTSCHAPALHHPVDIFPGKSLSSQLPLDPDGAITCTTCHDPHASPYSESPTVGRGVVSKLFDITFPLAYRKYPTYFLRVTNRGGKLCLSCHEKYDLMRQKKVKLPKLDEYVTSKGCLPCHPEEHSAWSKSLHSKMVKSPREDGSALVANLEDSGLVSYSEIAFVLGNHWVQRFVSQKGNKLVVRTPIWLISSGKWDLSYWREHDWIKSCAGCHVTALDPFSGKFAEKGVGCEACHGPGKKHAQSGAPDHIINPSRLERKKMYMICESCHTTGHDKTGEFRFPVGYTPGENLTDYFFGLQPKPGQDNESFRNNGTYEDRHNQFLYWLNNYISAVSETCDLCKNFRFKSVSHERKKPGINSYCRSCHDGERVPYPHGLGETAPGRCISCHEPEKSDVDSYSIHDHKFVPGRTS